jgi:hypothetical protein
MSRSDPTSSKLAKAQITLFALKESKKESLDWPVFEAMMPPGLQRSLSPEDSRYGD